MPSHTGMLLFEDGNQKQELLLKNTARWYHTINSNAEERPVPPTPYNLIKFEWITKDTLEMPKNVDTHVPTEDSYVWCIPWCDIVDEDAVLTFVPCKNEWEMAKHTACKHKVVGLHYLFLHRLQEIQTLNTDTEISKCDITLSLYLIIKKKNAHLREKLCDRWLE